MISTKEKLQTVLKDQQLLNFITNKVDKETKFKLYDYKVSKSIDALNTLYDFLDNDKISKIIQNYNVNTENGKSSEEKSSTDINIGGSIWEIPAEEESYKEFMTEYIPENNYVYNGLNIIQEDNKYKLLFY